MENRIFVLTGKRGVGKTTSLNSILSEILKTGIPVKGFRTYFNPEQHLILEWKNINETSVELGRKTSDHSLKPILESLDRVGDVLKKEIFSGQIFYADEIGFLESLSKNMQEGILNAINMSVLSLITLKSENYPFLKKIRSLAGLKEYNLNRLDYSERKNTEKEIFRFLRGLK
ncbi:MAG TPA: nucleoside-triphosphatase [Thermotogota bacterium]|nr:nucleoside-triphosphatase [Thermotogota bacterium]HPJ87952.1 nucleoside-triphosphatase [Thermotogota bacterium]HPR95039.1 nucleoside-triphosphatase [Thermotogota bacterium]